MVHQMFPVLLALHAGVIVSTFEITSHDPRTKPDSGLQFDEGDNLDLWCNANNWWEWCKFSHVQSNKSCELDWKKYALLDGKRTYVHNVTALDCDDFEGRFEYLGDYDNYRCGIRFKNLQPDEAGEWRCEMEEYYDGYGTNRGNGATDERSFFIEVEAKTTTTTAATTASSNAAAVDARSLARNATSTAVLVAVSSAAASAAGDRKHTTAAVALIGSLICGMGFLMYVE